MYMSEAAQRQVTIGSSTRPECAAGSGMHAACATGSKRPSTEGASREQVEQGALQRSERRAKFRAANQAASRGAERSVLLLFSGPFGQGIAKVLKARGIPCVEVDLTYGGVGHDLRDDGVFRELLRLARAGEFRCVVVAIPCNTFTVLRLKAGGPAQLRGREGSRRYGVSGLAHNCFVQVSQGNLLVRRSVLIAQAVGSFLFEHPADMGEPGSARFAEAWADHAPLWLLDEMVQLRETSGASLVTGDQCMCGGRFRKPTTWMASPDIAPAMAHLDGLSCTHGPGAHDEMVGVDDNGVYRSRAAAAYPPEVCDVMGRAAEGAGGVWRAFEGTTFSAGAGGVLHVGSARPHAVDGARATLQQTSDPHRAGLRAAEPETREALEAERLPVENEPPRTEWADPPSAPSGEVPGPFTTEQLIPQAAQDETQKFRVAVAAVFEAARRGRWRWAKDHRPSAVELSEEQALHPRGRGWSWERREDGLWHALQPSSWPDSPPGADLEVARIVEAAREGGYDDMEIISYIAHGYPGPEAARCTVLSPPHVGALREYEAFQKCASKDRARGWVRHSSWMPHVWPIRVDPQNIVMRFGKARMTTDKSMRMGSSLSYNECVDLTVWAAIEYVRVSKLGRGVMVLATAGVPVRAWGFDLEAFFRKTAKQRMHWWLSGLLHGDGFGLDTRVQFGQREAPVLCGRQSCFVIWMVRRELQRLDGEYASRDPLVLAWLDRRTQRMAAEGGTAAEWTALFICMIFVDDGGAASIDDLLFDHRGEPVMAMVSGQLVQQRRAMLHCEAALGVIRLLGHRESEGKTTWPGMELDYLGVTVDLNSWAMYLTLEKRDRYAADALRLLQGQTDERRMVVPFEDLNSLVHKLLHASCAVVLGRQHMHHLLRARTRRPAHREGGLRGDCRALGAEAVAELRWWVERLAERVGVPLASRRQFPAASMEGVVTLYADASKELSRLSESGFGGWAVFGDTLFYVEGRWAIWELEQFSINVLELAALFMTVFAMVELAEQLEARGDERAVGKPTHALLFTDNTAAEHSSERGRPHQRAMQLLIARGYEELP